MEMTQGDDMTTTQITASTASIDRDETIQSIRKALKARSGKSWSVKGGTGTAWGWITVTAPPARRSAFGSMTDADRKELAELLNLGDVHHQGVSIPASSAYRVEYVARAQGVTPIKHGMPYWD